MSWLWTVASPLSCPYLCRLCLFSDWALSPSEFYICILKSNIFRLDWVSVLRITVILGTDWPRFTRLVGWCVVVGSQPVRLWWAMCSVVTWGHLTLQIGRGIPSVLSLHTNIIATLHVPVLFSMENCLSVLYSFFLTYKNGWSAGAPWQHSHIPTSHWSKTNCKEWGEKITQLLRNYFPGS